MRCELDDAVAETAVDVALGADGQRAAREVVGVHVFVLREEEEAVADAAQLSRGLLRLPDRSRPTATERV